MSSSVRTFKAPPTSSSKGKRKAQVLQRLKRLSFAKKLKKDREDVPETYVPPTTIKAIKVEEVTTEQVNDMHIDVPPGSTFVTSTQLRNMGWKEKKDISSKRWSVRVTLCRGDAPPDLLAERVEYLKRKLESFPRTAKDGFIYAGDIELHRSLLVSTVSTYVCMVAITMESPLSYGQLVKSLGAFDTDVPRKSESLYFCSPSMGFPYWGMLQPTHDTSPTNVRELHTLGPLFVRGEPRNAFIPIKCFLRGI